jgi:L-serine dehydratase
MAIFDIIGPVMVGPSSSHTAGACRIGYIARKLLGEHPKEIQADLYGSFLTTGKGHGTDRAIVAGLLGMKPDDMRIPKSLTIAKEMGVDVSFGEAKLKEAHPNSVQLHLTGRSGKKMELIGQSIGGGRINIAEIDGIATNFSGEYPTLIVNNEDKPGLVAQVASMLSDQGVNVATMQLYRNQRDGMAVMVLECDQQIPKRGIEKLRNTDGVTNVTYLNPEEE